MLCGWEKLPAPQFPIIFHSIKGKDLRESNSPSYFNLEEAVIVRNRCDMLDIPTVTESVSGLVLFASLSSICENDGLIGLNGIRICRIDITAAQGSELESVYPSQQSFGY